MLSMVGGAARRLNAATADNIIMQAACSFIGRPTRDQWHSRRDSPHALWELGCDLRVTYLYLICQRIENFR